LARALTSAASIDGQPEICTDLDELLGDDP
jgi:hypothetical protein